MADERLDLRRFELSQWFPWTLLFRGFRLAREPKKIALGAMGALVMSLGWAAIASMFLSQGTPTLEYPENVTEEERKDVEANYHRARRTYNYASEFRRLPWNQGREVPPDSETPRTSRWPTGPGGIFRTPLNLDREDPDRKDGWTTPADIAVPTSTALVLEPLRQLTLPARMTFSDTNAVFVGLLLLLWTLAVWSFFGGAICRISAVQLARNGQVGLRESIRFVIGRYLSLFSSPMLPFLGIALVVFVCALGGLLTWVPVLNIFGGLFWIFALLAGFVIVVALIGLLLGWPLMYAAIGAEATESFDALSRSFSYVLGRPWHYLFYSLVAVVYGAILMVFAVTLAHGVVSMSAYATSFFYFSDTWKDWFAGLYYFTPTLPGWREEFGNVAAPTGLHSIAALLVGLWTHIVFLALIGFVYSFFWTEVTAIYLLLRRDVDETDLEEVYVEEEEEEPFPTATPTVPGPTKTTTRPASPPDAPPASPSLPIVDPPR